MSTTTIERPRASASAGYYEFERPEVIVLIPPGARRVLEFGCAAGACGARIRRERGAYVVGVELLPEPGEFDAILFADVLEHLRDPEAVIERVKPYLAPGGVIVASIPNARNASVVTMLARGDWTYQEAGLMDRTHIHFFTR